MHSDQEAQAPGEVEKKLTLKLLDAHAPGIVSFLNNLPARTEAAFIRGLIYQWLLENRDEEDFEQRLMAVLDGPGGRTAITTFAAQQRGPAPALRPRKPRAPRPAHAPASPVAAPAAVTQAAQIVMPGRDAARHQVSEPELTLPAGVPTTPASQVSQPLAPAPVPKTVAPEPLPTPAALPIQAFPQPIPVAQPALQPAAQEAPPEGVLDEAALAALDSFGSMF